MSTITVINNTTINSTNSNNHDTTNSSYLLALPLELRLQIYTYLLPPTQPISINHCTYLSTARLPTAKHQSRPSPISTYLTCRRLLTTWAREHGLHIPQVCRQLRSEYLGVMHGQHPRIEGHCVDCLGRAIGCLREGFGMGRKPVVKEWWVRLREGMGLEGRFGMGDWAGVDVERVVKELKEVIGKWFGGFAFEGRRLDGRDGREDYRYWYCDGLEQLDGNKEVVVEYVRIVGRVSRKRKRVCDVSDAAKAAMDVVGDVDIEMDDTPDLSDGNNEVGNDDDDDDQDDFNTHSSRGAYNYNPAVVETERAIRRYHVDRHREMNKVMRMMSNSHVFLEDGDGDEAVSGWWRKSRGLNAERGRGKGWAVREEVWIGCVFK